MRLITSSDNDCVAASLAMLFDMDIEFVKRQLFFDPPYYPFPAPWDNCPMVPSMELICDWAYSFHEIALVPFPFDPVCAPHPDCTPVSVWPDDPTTVFKHQLGYGPGLLEGLFGGAGHMCAWDGDTVFDPHGYTYPVESCHKLGYTLTRFWLAVHGRQT